MASHAADGIATDNGHKPKHAAKAQKPAAKKIKIGGGMAALRDMRNSGGF